MTNLLILVDGGGSIGFGHITRCLAIKSAWKYGVVKLLAYMEDEVAPPDGAEFFDWLNQPEKLGQFASADTALLVDSYQASIDFFHSANNIFKFVAALDDYNRISYPVDLVICPGIYGKNIDYSNQSANVKGGAEYVVLRPDVLATTKKSIEDAIRTILVTFGGSQCDEKLYQNVINVLESYNFKAIVITGNDDLLEKIVVNTSELHGRVAPAVMTEFMKTADMAICSAGQTLNELAWLGVPTFLIKTGEDQQENWSYYIHHNLVMAAVSHDDVDWTYLLRATLVNETYERRQGLSRQLKNLLTDNGAEHICSAIHNSANALND